MIEPLGPCGQHLMGGCIVNDRGASAPANVGPLGAEGPPEDEGPGTIC